MANHYIHGSKPLQPRSKPVNPLQQIIIRTPPTPRCSDYFYPWIDFVDPSKLPKGKVDATIKHTTSTTPDGRTVYNEWRGRVCMGGCISNTPVPPLQA